VKKILHDFISRRFLPYHGQRLAALNPGREIVQIVNTKSVWSWSEELIAFYCPQSVTAYECSNIPNLRFWTCLSIYRPLKSNSNSLSLSDFLISLNKLALEVENTMKENPGLSLLKKNLIYAFFYSVEHLCLCRNKNLLWRGQASVFFHHFLTYWASSVFYNEY